jgi:hypothetical protein
LKLHPDSVCTAVERIDVDVARQPGGGSTLCYVVTGRIGELLIPSTSELGERRADGLWRHTCFEAFIKAPADAAYHEFNFAPSGRWAAYRFDGYRAGMAKLTEAQAPRIGLRSNPEAIEVLVQFGADALSGLRSTSTWRLGLAAVIEEINGAKSYWALAHPPGEPDFHHSDCFVGDLPAAEGS